MERHTRLCSAGLNGQLFTGFGTMAMLLAEVILQMRVYALFGRNRMNLVAFVILTALLFGFNILQLTRFLIDSEDNVPLERLSLKSNFIPLTCTGALPMSGIAWSVTAFVELLLFLLVIWKTIQLRKEYVLGYDKGHIFKTQDIVALMARDSIVYFALIFSVCSMGVVITFVQEHDKGLDGDIGFTIENLKNAYQTVVITVMTIFAPQLLINLRAESYGPVGIIATQLTTWNAEAGTYFTSTFEFAVAANPAMTVGLASLHSAHPMTSGSSENESPKRLSV
ncbi:uncharacterized protein FOMMEDRAFT_166829 [Fomitiporia mediterranea MF3/22]|uniref:uncharacterized protein n=1 Tax=Fomitiporia mediterranea (strain MF3/22) TaxID=694068 RepID=UPI0004407DFA|nr:uncharacterized protein FOMMEDRAFT_166829 [Fomitiporia mediterranea MF3/22]EJD05212.1 hypothetical protein FOMMEDRAFT_166829 [Fomitiporia mediterranea MF3/22]